MTSIVDKITGGRGEQLLKIAFVYGVPVLAVVHMFWAVHNDLINVFKTVMMIGDIPNGAGFAFLLWMLWFLLYMGTLLLSAFLAIKNRKKSGEDLLSGLRDYIKWNAIVRGGLFGLYFLLAIVMFMGLDASWIDGTEIFGIWMLFLIVMLIVELVYNGVWFFVFKIARRKFK